MKTPMETKKYFKKLNAGSVLAPFLPQKDLFSHHKKLLLVLHHSKVLEDASFSSSRWCDLPVCPGRTLSPSVQRGMWIWSSLILATQSFFAWHLSVYKHFYISFLGTISTTNREVGYRGDGFCHFTGSYLSGSARPWIYNFSLSDLHSFFFFLSQYHINAGAPTTAYISTV